MLYLEHAADEETSGIDVVDDFIDAVATLERNDDTGPLELIAGLGGGTVEGYPEPAGDVPAGFLYHGVLSSFERAGFRQDRKIGKYGGVVTKRVAPT
jgi:hypothetical protein